MIGSGTATSYDDVPYPSFPLAQTHPDRLATLATLFGITPPPIDGCRVLELGCADGGNLIAMAEGLPGSQFVGVDLSARQVATGRAAVEAVGLGNVSLRQASILDLGDDLGRFDYILCHGVYSWVPAPVQDRILAICRQHLSPPGVAYVSYNTYPGWHTRQAVRRMMQYHVARTADPSAAINAARDLLAFLLEVVPADLAAYRILLEEENERLAPVRDTYIFHEHLEDVNAPVYFQEFIERAARHGLQFLTEVDFCTRLTKRLPPAVSAALDRLAGDPLQREQYVDFLTNRMFRQTLLCHREVRLHAEPRAEHLAGLYVASCAECVSPPVNYLSGRPEEFRGPNKVVATTSHAISKAALVCMAEIWPRAMPFVDLQAEARARIVGDSVVVQDAAGHARDSWLLAENLFQAFTAEVVELHAHPPALALEPGEHPRAPAFARQQARDGAWVTNAFHQMVNLDPATRQLLRHLDGRHDHAALVEEMVSAAGDKTIVLERFGRPVTDPDRLRAILRRELDTNLRGLIRSALLVSNRV
jgi:methyltransferase-like protein/2-polyprenyl-3-methyl-5-hydroxy-6-metoxy-1,4-benzoquinol methylase